MFTYSSLTIRPVEESDLETLRRLRNDQSTWENLHRLVHLSEVNQHDWFSSGAANLFYSVIKDGNLVGIVRTSKRDYINRSICIGADILPEYRRQGIATNLYRLLLKWFFDYQNCHRIWLEVLDTNKGAASLYQKIGFKEEGRIRDKVFRNGKWIDSIMMSILEKEWQETFRGQHD